MLSSPFCRGQRLIECICSRTEGSLRASTTGRSDRQRDLDPPKRGWSQGGRKGEILRNTRRGERMRQRLVDLRTHRSGGHMRSVFVMTLVATLVAANSVAAQTTSAPPAAAPAPSAPATGAPALAPTPGTPSPGGVTQMPSPSVNSTPSQSNVDLYPPTRVLPNPAPSAGTPGAASPGQIPPGGVTQGRAPSGAAQRGGANDRNPVGTDTDDCMKLWDPQTPVSKEDWARACERNQAGLKKPDQ
jgi:hypothetical protein